MHPARELKCTQSDKLEGRKIVLGVTGSIAAVDSVRLCRELIRHGADVHVVMSGDARKIIHPNSLEFASGNPVVTEIDGKVQHVALCGSVRDKADLLLIAPATANTISKIACGIDDTPVTTFATTALGAGIPTVLVPAMHGSMMKHRIVLDNIDRLREAGMIILEPRSEEGKAKMPLIDDIVAVAISRAGRGDMRSRRVLVIAGATEEPLDDIRIIANRSSGETGAELARAAFERGAEVELWMGRCSVEIPRFVRTRRFIGSMDLEEMVDSMNRADIVLFPAAVSDYRPDPVEGKMPSSEASLTLTLKRTPKIIDKVDGETVVGFKAQSRVTDDELVAEAVALIKRAGCAFVVANSVEDVQTGSTRVLMVDADGRSEEASGSKTTVADRILDRALKG